MAVTILQRPEGAILSTNGVSGALTDFAGDAVITAVSHGLSADQIVYIESDVEDYNGFWYVSVSSANQFQLKRYPTDMAVDYIADATVTYYASTYNHGWSCVHLPITYRLSNDLYPTNSADTTRNINSVQEANGYTVLQLSGSLGSGVNTYDFVKITVPLDTDLSGVYQILEFISPTVLLINLLYDSGNNFTGATALKHYNNYNIIVRVYAGINASHQWTAQKPYELAATIEYIPDENNEVFFSINELLKSYIETRNNTLLGTLPNNIDFWTNFYIETAERYDDSDGYTFGTNTSAYTSDQSNFEGTAVNAKLEFKNPQSGYLSDYLMTNNAAKFLTLFTIPVLFQCGDDTPNCYSDISFLSVGDAIVLKQEFYLNGTLQTTTYEDIETSSGVIRTELEADCTYDRVDLTLIGLEAWTSEVSAADNNWRAVTYGNGLFVAVSSNGTGDRVMTSPDGETWTSRTSAADNSWQGVTYGNSLFVAVASTGTDRVMTSPDGITWTLRSTAGDAEQWVDVVYGNGLYVAVGVGGGAVMTSPDGITWTLRTIPSANDLYSVTYGNSLFVAVGDSGYTITSTDGITWTQRTPASLSDWVGITYADRLFVAVSNVGSVNSISTSPDGITWTLRTAPNTNVIEAVTYGNNLFVAITSTGTGNRAIKSNDGINWVADDTTADNDWRWVTFGNGIFVAVAASGTGDRVMITSEGNFSETKQFRIDCGCVNQEIRLTWLNNLAGFDYWAFTGKKDVIREIQEVMTTKKNILPTWPKSYGADADTIKKQTKRVSNKAYTVRSQFLTADEADALSYIKSSILVQIINSQSDRRTVTVDSDSFIVRKDGDDTHEVAFNISFTDDIPVQTA